MIDAVAGVVSRLHLVPSHQTTMAAVAGNGALARRPLVLSARESAVFVKQRALGADTPLAGHLHKYVRFLWIHPPSRGPPVAGGGG